MHERFRAGVDDRYEVTHVDETLPAWARAALEANIKGPNRNFNGELCLSAIEYGQPIGVFLCIKY